MRQEDQHLPARARKDSLRVTVIGPTPPLRGGIAHYTTALVRALRTRHLVQAVGLRRQYPKRFFPGTTEEDRSAVTMAFAPDLLLDPLAPQSWPATTRAIATWAPDLIVVSWWNPALGAVLATFVRLLRRRCGARVVFLCHNVGAHDATPIDRVLTTYAFHSADGAIVHSEADARRVTEQLSTLAVARTTHPTYDLPEFGAPIDAARARAQLGLHGDVLLFFGLVRRYKGLVDLLRAMPHILAVRPCTLVVAGEFYEPRAPYDELVRALNLAEHVQLRDQYVANEEVGVYFSAADMLIAPYRSATQSGVVALAKQFQRPVVVSRVGGLPDMIEDGVTGLIVPPGDPEALAAAVLRIYAEGAATWQARVQAASGTSWMSEIDAIERLAAL